MLKLKLASRLGIANKYDYNFKWLVRLTKRIKILFRNQPKVFIIGLNKTGTTSVFVALKELGFEMSNQHDAERIYNEILNGTKSNNDLLKYCKYYEGFQDIPFSVPGTYKILDKKFKNSKYILTVRSSETEWCSSFRKYYDVEGSLHKNNYLSPGFLFKTFKEVFGSADFSEQTCKNVYNNHYSDVLHYFKNRNQDLLVLNVASSGAYLEFCKFLNKKPKRESFEWKNKLTVNQV